MQGDKLKGDRANIKRLQDSFHAEVGSQHGLSRSDYRRLSAKSKQSIEQAVLTCLRADCVLKSSIWPSVRDAIHKDPLPFAQLLGIVASKPTKKAPKSFVDHKRSKGKGSFIT